MAEVTCPTVRPKGTRHFTEFNATVLKHLLAKGLQILLAQGHIVKAVRSAGRMHGLRVKIYVIAGHIH
jgi:translation initiation factor IF-1